LPLDTLVQQQKKAFSREEANDDFFGGSSASSYNSGSSWGRIGLPERPGTAGVKKVRCSTQYNDVMRINESLNIHFTILI
jgi:hypothetical protein